MKRVALTFLIGFVGVLLMACAGRFRARDLADFSGITFCLRPTLAVSVLNLEVWGTADMVTTPAHEAKHREQFRRWPSCKAVNAYYRTKAGHLAMEAEAYAAGYCAGIRAGLDTAATEEDMRTRLVNAMRGWASDEAADSAFTRFAVCS